MGSFHFIHSELKNIFGSATFAEKTCFQKSYHWCVSIYTRRLKKEHYFQIMEKFLYTHTELKK